MTRFVQSVRTALPSGLKRLLRAVRIAIDPPPASPALDASLLKGCRFLASRQDLVAALPRRGVVGEIGTQHGYFARAILKVARPQRLHLFDLDFSALAPDVAAHPCVMCHTGRSAETVAAMPDGSFDWIYVDGDHSYRGVCADIAAAAPKLRQGGYLVFNDFAHVDTGLGRYGVHRAVTEFAARERWQFAMFAYERHGLYDIALRKPG